MARSTLTVFFENPFWVGVYERIDGDRYEVCKITFGAEPKDYEVWDFLLKNWSKLKFSPPIKAERVEERKINPTLGQLVPKSFRKGKGRGAALRRRPLVCYSFGREVQWRTSS